MNNQKLTFYIGVHNKDVTFKDEVVEKIEMDIVKAEKLLRALHETLNYLTTGE